MKDISFFLSDARIRFILFYWRKMVMDKMRKKTFEDFKKYVEIKKGILLSEEYVNKSTKVRIKCDKEHIWEVSFGAIYYDKSWCPFCKEEERKKDYFKKNKKI